MLAPLLRPKKRHVYPERSPFSSPYTPRETTPLNRDYPQQSRYGGFQGRDNEFGHDDIIAEEEYENGEEEGQEGEVDDEDEAHESSPLLPIFSASHLDALPVYDITHAIRSLIASRCETTLSWDQLRSPQISQFLVKPIQQRIMASHFSRATLYALMTNCLQFNKEVQLYPANSGTSQTRAMVSELLAIKMLRDYTTRELIDALSYEFYPLQAQTSGANGNLHTARGWSASRHLAGTARISCLEIAIRAQAKRFLAHPVVVQQLEAIWAGTIVFHSAADSLHRTHTKGRLNRGPTHSHTGSDISENRMIPVRRSVTLYDPRDASLFKLSRLRVPRYRQFLSTISFAVLLGLFVAVLQQRQLEISTLEIIFWLWSAGYMLDEIVGFNEQGFSLYLMSFWNVFDLGILLLLFCYYCMRLFGAVIPFTRQEMVADEAYDILAASAVLLFPRLFSVLDHYRYFSQLLIAFRIMAADLIAVFVLIVIACSGFLVAFTFAFGNRDEQSAGSVAYALFQMLMGFSPAAWTLWDEYNFLGKTILTVFLFICHFVIITILITVLTNSFMRIVQNAYQEHQFLFAVNTISMVKSDALFSYVAPTNLLAWVITPLRFLMPFRQFVKLNRTIIKVTHLPILFTICFYEKTILASKVIEPTDLVDLPAPREATPAATRRPGTNRFKTFNAKVPRLVREPSVATYQKDCALDEVFHRLFKDESVRRGANTTQGQEDSNIVNTWMQGMGSGPIHPPDEQDPKEVDRLERLPKRLRFPFQTRLQESLRDFTETSRSVASNPEDMAGHQRLQPGAVHRGRNPFLPPERARQLSRHTDIEGDDERTSDDNEDKQSIARNSNSSSDSGQQTARETSGPPPKFYSSRPSTAKHLSRRTSPTRRPKIHSRTVSSATMWYGPTRPENRAEDGATPSVPVRPRAETPERAVSTSVDQLITMRGDLNPSRAYNTDTLSRSHPMPVPDFGGTSAPDSHPRGGGRGQNPFLFGLGSDIGDNRAIANEFIGGLPGSLTTEMAYATGLHRPISPENQNRLSKLVLARMNNIEEGFREVIKEVKDLRRGESSRSQSQPDDFRDAQRERERKRRIEKKEGKKRSHGSRVTRTSTSSDSPLSDVSSE